MVSVGFLFDEEPWRLSIFCPIWQSTGSKRMRQYRSFNSQLLLQPSFYLLTFNPFLERESSLGATVLIFFRSSRTGSPLEVRLDPVLQQETRQDRQATATFVNSSPKVSHSGNFLICYYLYCLPDLSPRQTYAACQYAL